MTQQGLLSLTPPLLVPTPSTNSARVCWATAPGLLSRTQQGFAEPQLLLYDSADSAESTIHNIYKTGGLSTRVTESPPQAQQGFAEPTLDLCTTSRLSRRTESRSHSTQRRDSAEESSWVWLSTNSTEIQPKDTARSGSLLTAQGLHRRM